MLIYSINKIPDLTLSKYQSFADTGIDGMLHAQTQFIKQIYRIAILYEIDIHFIFNYDTARAAGMKLKIFIAFSENENKKDVLDNLRKFIEALDIYRHFEMSECIVEPLIIGTFKNMSIMSKKERILQTTINAEQKFFYLVPNWEMNEETRLYRLLQLMQSFDENCCYRVDLYVEKDIEEQIHRNFERPLSYLRNLYNSDKGISEYSKMKKVDRDPNIDEILRQYEEWIKKIDTSLPFRCRVCAFTEDGDYGQLLLNTVFSEAINSGNAKLMTQNGNYNIFSEINNLPNGYCGTDCPKSMQKWSTTFTVEEVAAFTRLPLLYDGENIELPKETYVSQESSGIILGKDKNQYPVYIPQKNLPKHMFICGVPGSGKTNTMLHLANSLWNGELIDKNGKTTKSRIPFLVLEPAKREYRELALFDIPELIIFSPSACTDFPLRINPFEFPKGLTLSEHLNLSILTLFTPDEGLSIDEMQKYAYAIDGNIYVDSFRESILQAIDVVLKEDKDVYDDEQLEDKIIFE